MLITLPDILDTSALEQARAVLTRTPFTEGRASAGRDARPVKHNTEADRSRHNLADLDNLVMGCLVRHPVYQAAALPLRVAAPFYARYTPGMAYGDHVDDPIMGAAEGAPFRADIAITIFLCAPDDYEGGELIIRTSFGEQAVKLPAGHGLLYPASSLHRVAPVTRGARLVAVSWAQSLVRDPARRELLYDLYRAKEGLRATQPKLSETEAVNHVYINLVRMWGEL